MVKNIFLILLTGCILIMGCNVYDTSSYDDPNLSFFREEHLQGDIKYIRDSIWLITPDTLANQQYYFSIAYYKFPRKKEAENTSSTTASTTAIDSTADTTYFSDATDTASESTLVPGTPFESGRAWYGSGTRFVDDDTVGIEAYLNSNGIFQQSRRMFRDARLGLRVLSPTWDYSNLGSTITTKEYAVEASNVFLRAEYQCDQHNNLLSLEQYNHDTLYQKYVFKYNNNLQITECRVYNVANVLIYRLAYYYNNQLQTGYTIYDYDKKLLIWT